MNAKTIFGLLVLFIISIVMLLYFFNLPSKEDKLLAKENHIREMRKYEDIDEITVIYKWTKVIKK